jgi:predicted 3-demethylubiquinone-9 3-methyltransferase (glyoxalase superfamily)
MCTEPHDVLSISTMLIRRSGRLPLSCPCDAETQMQTITPFLWLDGQAEAAAAFYVSIFHNSRILGVSRYGDAGRERHGQAPGTVMTVDFELDGQHFTALNGGPHFRLTPAVSFVVHCKAQAEVDHYWSKLGEGGRLKRSSAAGLRTVSGSRGR